MVADDILQRASAGDLAALVELDARGLLMGANETAEAYAARLRELREHYGVMEAALAEEGRYEIEGVAVDAHARIPSELFGRARAVTRDMYGFDADWVPGFFVDMTFGWFFGGCAFHFFPDFFTLFIIRRSFAERERWLIYNRDELLAHEMCHVARVALDSTVFEEVFAYQTATTGFRRSVGSVFRSPLDSYMLLGVTAILLAAQVLRLFVFPSLWIAPFWGLVLAVGVFLGWRQWRCRGAFSRALANLAGRAGSDAMAACYRCTDEEIVRLGQLTDSGELSEWLDYRCRTSTRWRVIEARFLGGGIPEDEAEGAAEAETCTDDQKEQRVDACEP